MLKLLCSALLYIPWTAWSTPYGALRIDSSKAVMLHLCHLTAHIFELKVSRPMYVHHLPSYDDHVPLQLPYDGLSFSYTTCAWDLSEAFATVLLEGHLNTSPWVLTLQVKAICKHIHIRVLRAYTLIRRGVFSLFLQTPRLQQIRVTKHGFYLQLQTKQYSPMCHCI